MPEINLYTDGSCLGNPGIGGWAYILKYEAKNYEKEGFGAEQNTTNNRMELKAIIEALKLIKQPCKINLYTDSNLMVQSINEWIFKWIKTNFKGKKNVDLWQEYLNLSKEHRIKAFWLKAHNGHKENERCDFLARNEALKLQKSME
ncbi:ribonuclease HI [Campylobacter avium LMG 24591]|uniref:ribonuclease H n=1 Tax=Campylobacter avium LMG 24591 TaxID=522484 RepID=A0A222MZ18_9BACT|nr:ribonuclease HI [Campylobacter avium]ASQ31237.1 ribonuclease HI [Campylobacter avium LMG 24591]OYD79911.1 ribonuclease HI [Campylobacter avium]